MRGNKAVAVALTPATNPYLIADYVGGAAIANPPETCSAPAGCTSSLNVASWEKTDWLTRVNATFPGVHVQVCYDNAPYTAGGIPQWGCAGLAAAGGSISIKIGWVRASTNNDRSTTTAIAGALTTVTGANASPPSVIYLVTPGS